MSQMDQESRRESSLWVDSSRCIGCYSCEVACKMEHDLPAGPRPITVMQVGPLQHEDKLVMVFQPVACLHCAYPSCVPVCPTGAMQKRDDEIVFSDPELCIGCQTCAIACPFGIPQLNPGTGKITKCDGCMERGEKSLSPACVLACPTGALSFVPPTTKTQRARERIALVMRQLGSLR